MRLEITTNNMAIRQLAVLILAAGQGKRMHASIPKVLVPLSGRPLLFYPLEELKALVAQTGWSVKVAVVVGFQKDSVIEALQAYKATDLPYQLDWIVQEQQLGTGDAARAALKSSWGKAVLEQKLDVLVLPGDLPLVQVSMLKELAEPLTAGRSGKPVMRLLTTVLPDPRGYGRVVRRGKAKQPLKIVEEKDASDRERLITEVACSIYLFQSSFLNSGLARLTPKNQQAEYYLTDLVEQASRANRRVDVLPWSDSQDLRGVNNPWELAQAATGLNHRLVQYWAEKGVRFRDPQAVWIDPDVSLGAEVIVGPGVVLEGATHIGDRAELGPNVHCISASVGAGVRLKTGTIIDTSEVGMDCQIGPYAHFRPGSRTGPNCRIGNFVELKATSVGASTNIAHLSYVGDAVVGSRVNIGCGFITCNFDGRVIDGKRKHVTTIEDDVFVGSDCQALAPILLKRGSYIASGSTLTEDVPEDTLAIARVRQINKLGYAKKLRSKEG